MEQNNLCVVKNRSSNNVSYLIADSGVKRIFRPGEVKQITYEELVKLSFEPGGRVLMDRYFFIQKKEVTANLGLKREIEYDWDEARIKQLLTTDSLDQFLDCLDFAPKGVIDIIKTMAIELPLGDPLKKKALREKTGLDVDAIYRNTVEGDEDSLSEKKSTPERRVKTETTGRRYNVVG